MKENKNMVYLFALVAVILISAACYFIPEFIFRSIVIFFLLTIMINIGDAVKQNNKNENEL